MVSVMEERWDTRVRHVTWLQSNNQYSIGETQYRWLQSQFLLIHFLLTNILFGSCNFLLVSLRSPHGKCEAQLNNERQFYLYFRPFVV